MDLTIHSRHSECPDLLPMPNIASKSIGSPFSSFGIDGKYLHYDVTTGVAADRWFGGTVRQEPFINAVVVEPTDCLDENTHMLEATSKWTL